MEKENVEMASFTESLLSWMQSDSKLVLLIIAIYLIAFVLIKKDSIL